MQHGMKTRTIKAVLSAKIEDWLKSIDNEDVRAAAKKDVLVCGGAIASMLLGEKVNDYDVYFRNMETTEMVARYYVHAFNKENALKSKPKPIKPEVRVITRRNLKGVEERRVTVWIQSAGVAGAGNEGDYDYFEGRSAEATHHYVDGLMPQAREVCDDVRPNKKPPYRPVFLSENAITLTGGVQIVCRFAGDPDKIFDNYDFVHAMNYYHYAYGRLEIKQAALESLLSRELIYVGSLYPLCSLFRIRKFLGRGWRISAGQILKIAAQVAEIDFSNPSMLREQLIGVDMAYMHQLIRELEKVAPGERIDSTYLALLIDKVFEKDL